MLCVSYIVICALIRSSWCIISTLAHSLPLDLIRLTWLRESENHWSLRRMDRAGCSSSGSLTWPNPSRCHLHPPQQRRKDRLQKNCTSFEASLAWIVTKGDCETHRSAYLTHSTFKQLNASHLCLTRGDQKPQKPHALVFLKSLLPTVFQETCSLRGRTSWALCMLILQGLSKHLAFSFHRWNCGHLVGRNIKIRCLLNPNQRWWPVL